MPSELRDVIARLTDRPWRQGSIETDRVFVPDPNGLAGPGGERVMLRLNTNGQYAGSAAGNCRAIVALVNHADALVALAGAVAQRIAARCHTQSATTDDYTKLEYNECAGGTHCSMCPVSRADAAIVEAYQALEAVT